MREGRAETRERAFVMQSPSGVPRERRLVSQAEEGGGRRKTRGASERWRRRRDAPPALAFEKISAHRLGCLYGTSEAWPQEEVMEGLKILRLARSRNLHLSPPQHRSVETLQTLYDTLRRPRGRRGVSAAAIPSRSSPTSNVANPKMPSLRRRVGTERPRLRGQAGARRGRQSTDVQGHQGQGTTVRRSAARP
jgi:hypothetical protein